MLQTLSESQTITVRVHKLVLDVERSASERYLMNDNSEAVDVSRLCACYVCVTKSLFFSQ